MKASLFNWKAGSDFSPPNLLCDPDDISLVIYFGGKGLIDSGDCYQKLKAQYPNANIIGCSTGGEIFNEDALDDTIVAATLQFEHTLIKTACFDLNDNSNSYEAGRYLAAQLNQTNNLKYVFLLSDGTNMNGSELIRGLYSVFPKEVIVTGGLAGDGADFGDTFVGVNAIPAPRKVAAVGFYGDAITVEYGSAGGWQPFGPERTITRSEGNVLYELDGQPALKLYKEYLGEEAKHLPGSALLYPLLIRPDTSSEHETVRTIVGINEQAQSLIFAGDIPEGYVAKLMYGDFNNLVEGAERAAGFAEHSEIKDGALAILVSCIGRKLCLGQSVGDETEAVAALFGNKVPMIGFYSYGEICHQQFTKECALHNQTMTITVLSEKPY